MTIKKKANVNTRKYNQDIIRERKVKRTQKLCKSKFIALPDKPGRDVRVQDNITEHIDAFYT